MNSLQIVRAMDEVVIDGNRRRSSYKLPEEVCCGALLISHGIHAFGSAI